MAVKKTIKKKIKQSWKKEIVQVKPKKVEAF
jgi:hypothetical protein